MPGFEYPPVPPQGVEDFSEINLIGAASGTIVLTAKVQGDTQTRFAVTASGAMSWGDGSAAKDITLSRSAAGILEQKSGTQAQQFRVYGTETGPHYTTVGHDGADGYVNVVGGGTLGLRITGTVQWFISSSILGCATDNAEDIGASGATRPRTLYLGTRILNADGSSATPSYSFAGGTDLGFLRGSATTIWFAAGAAGRMSFGTTGLYLVSGGLFGWSSNATNPDTAADVILSRDGGAGILALKNGANACRYRAYGNATIYTEVRHDGTNGQMGSSSGRLQLYSNNTNAFFIETTGHILWNTDNSMDVGASGATRPRTIYWGTQALGPVGSVTVPSFSFAGFTTTGIYSRSTSVNVTTGNADRMEIGSGYIALNGSSNLYWVAGSTITAAVSVQLAREADGILAQRNTTNAQIFRIYRTFTDAANYERVHIGNNFFGDNFFGLIVEAAGTGLARGLYISNNTNQGIIFRTNNTNRWNMNSTGHILTDVDNALDIGASGATRPRTIYIGTSLNVVAGAVTLDTNGITMGDAKNIIVNATTGTKIGTATTQKLAFWNATPIVQPAGIANADGTLADITTKFNTLLNNVIEAVGLTATV